MAVCEDLATKMLTTALGKIGKKNKTLNYTQPVFFFFFYNWLLSRESYDAFKQ